MFRIHPPKCRKNNALFCCFQLRNMLKNPCWKNQLESIWCWKLSDFLIASSNAILTSETWVVDGKLHLNFLWAYPFNLLETSCPFWPLILAVLAPNLGRFGPSWPYGPSWPFEPLLLVRAPIGFLSPYWPLGPLLFFLALLGFFGSSWSFWPPYVFSSLLDITWMLAIIRQNHFVLIIVFLVM